VASYKPGNVSFTDAHGDMTSVDFLFSAAAIAPVMERAPLRRVGDTILDSVRATRRVTNVNTNLGIVLLLAPLASVPPYSDLRGGLTRALLRLDVDDARRAYEAIRLANPGGLGRVDEQDVAAEPTVTLREAMALAADRDLVARQYVNDFEQVFEGVEILREELASSPQGLGPAITWLYCRLLAKYADSLLVRKHGREVAEEASRLAQAVVQKRKRPDRIELWGFAGWLRGTTESGVRNPGTTADLVTACLFAALRTGMIQVPLDPPFRANFPDA
jgi:triphosphoribosyl-dephospho-CoA synthase